MIAVRWILPLTCALASACSCMETSTVGGQDAGADQENTDRIDPSDDAGFEDGLPEALPMPPVCGDGILDLGEECDDGNRQNGDGCDWQCRTGWDPYEYPPPDPEMHPVEPTGPPQVVTDETEMSIFVSGGTYGYPCHPIWLTAGGGRFALAYDYDQPYYGMALRILDPTGRTVGDPWKHETRWALFEQALFPTDDGFGLLSGSAAYGIMRSRFSLDGAPLEELLTLRPSRETSDPWDALLSGAYSSGRWLAVSSLNGLECHGWLLESFAEEGAPVGLSLLDIWTAGLCVSTVSNDTGFAVGTGAELVILDHDLNVVSWSGLLRGEESNRTDGAVSLSSDGFWVAWFSNACRNPPETKSLSVAALDLDGAPRFPPRRILEGLPNIYSESGPSPGTHVPELSIAHGPAGAAIVYWAGVGDRETEGGPVMLVTVDGWGNVITPPTPVLEEGEITIVGWVLAAAADDQGYGVVTMTSGTVPGTGSLVFRHFAVAP